MEQYSRLAQHCAAPDRPCGGDPLALQALRQWRDSLARRLERPAPHASIDERHDLLLELARCALDLSAMKADAPIFSDEHATGSPCVASDQPEIQQLLPWQTSTPYFLPANRT